MESSTKTNSRPLSYTPHTLATRPSAGATSTENRNREEVEIPLDSGTEIGTAPNTARDNGAAPSGIAGMLSKLPWSTAPKPSTTSTSDDVGHEEDTALAEP